MFKPAAVFSDNMVLQREKYIRVFGEGDDGRVEVRFNGACVSCEISDGRWEAVLPEMKAADGLEMTIRNKDKEYVFKNIAIGEVWLAGGPSNMELELQNALNGKEYLSKLTSDMPVRFYYTNKAKTVENAREMEMHAGWGLCDKEGSKAWSAVGYHFAAKLAKELGVIVGVIGCNWGGTSASAWVSRHTLETDKDLNSYLEEYAEKTAGKTDEELIAAYKEYELEEIKFNEGQAKLYAENPDITWDEVQQKLGVCQWPGPMAPNNPFRPCGLYETMVMRVAPYTLRGFLYYQGESDDHKPQMYYKLLTRLIDRWRTDWKDDTLPFEIVQLPMFKYKNDPDYKHWCRIREAQMKAYRTIKNTGIAVVSDCGEFDNIHPVDKKPVGERLALQAMKNVYGIDCEAFGPVFKDVYFSEHKAEISFFHAKQGFEIRGEVITGFEAAGRDKVFEEVKAEICGDRIILETKCKEPLYVRYDWYNWIEPSVFGAESKIPLAPFRSSAEDE